MNEAAGVNGLNGMNDAAGVIELWGVPPPLLDLTADEIALYRRYCLPRGEGSFVSKLLVRTEKGIPESDVDLDVRAPKWRPTETLPFRKNVYREHFATARRSSVDVDAYRKTKDIAVEGRAVPKPVLRLYEANFPDGVLEGIEAGKYGLPTDIQAQCWPIALKGRDLMATVRGGARDTTLAYLLPAIVHVMHQLPLHPGDGPIVLVLAATPELARQTHELNCHFEKYTAVSSVCLSCGDWKLRQLKALKRGPCEVCVASPGRLLSFLKEGKVNLRRCSYLVMDRVDLMLIMGLEKPIRAINALVHPVCQKIMLVASPNWAVSHLADELMHDYIQVSFGLQTAHQSGQIEHIVVICGEAEKDDKLIAIFEDILIKKCDKVIVFAGTRHSLNVLVLKLRMLDWPVVAIHGGMTEGIRDRELNAFRKGLATILVATDAVTRQLDDGDVRFVINYDYPLCLEDYHKRVEHAARCAGQGTAYTFISPNDRRRAKELIAILRANKQTVNPRLRELATKVLDAAKY
nr:probable ATP-dependent RNA helicase DDX5 [Dermacentor andersoni]